MALTYHVFLRFHYSKIDVNFRKSRKGKEIKVQYWFKHRSSQPNLKFIIEIIILCSKSKDG